MNFLVLGAGAVGSVIGGLLAAQGHRVTLVGRAAHMDAIRGGGLAISGIWGTRTVRDLATATAIPPGGGVYDFVLLTVKAYDTAEAAQALVASGARARHVVSIQNGHGNTAILEARLPESVVLGARIITGVEQVRPGSVDVTVSADALRIGAPGGEGGRLAPARELASALAAAGVPAEATPHYREYLWDKILYNNALNPLGALLRARYGELAQDAPTREWMEAIIRESHATARAAGIPLFWATADDYCAHFYDKLIPVTASHYPSMLRDLERRGRTEIHALNGAVVRLADQCGIAAPVNRMVTAMIELREKTRRAEIAQ